MAAADTHVVASHAGWRRRGRDGRRRVDDGQAAVERRLTADGTLLHGQRETRVVGIAEAARHAVASQAVEEVT